LSLGPHGAGALAFRRPTAASEVLASAQLRPRFLEPPDANGRTLSGTSAASTSRSGTRRTGRCPSRPRAQCIAAPDENRSRFALRSTLAKGVLRERDVGYVTVMGTYVKGNVSLLGTCRGVIRRPIAERRSGIRQLASRAFSDSCNIPDARLHTPSNSAGTHFSAGQRLQL
jgi:hypothetical protein